MPTAPKPLFSVIVPFQNAEATLPEALASLRAQTEPDWEALLIDDASRDGSTALVRAEESRDPRLRLIHDPHQRQSRGIAASRNLGIAAARGEYLALLDADDRWLPEKLAEQRRAFENGADIVFSAYRRVDRVGRILGTVPARACVTWEDALAGNPIGALTGAWRRARFPSAVMPMRVMHEDYAFWLDLLREGATAEGLPEVLAEYRVQPGSASSNKLRAAVEVWKILGEEGLGWYRRSQCFMFYALNAIGRRV